MARKDFEIRDQLSFPLKAPLSHRQVKEITKSLQQLLFRQNAMTVKLKNDFIRFRGETQKLKTPYKLSDEVEKPPRTFLKNARYGSLKITHDDQQVTVTWRIGMPPLSFWIKLTAIWTCFTIGASGLAWILGIKNAIFLIVMLGGLPYLILWTDHRNYARFKDDIREALRLGMIEE